VSRGSLVISALIAAAAVAVDGVAQAATVAFKSGDGCTILASAHQELFNPKLPPPIIETLYTLLWVDERPGFFVVYEQFSGGDGTYAQNRLSFMPKDGRDRQRVLRDVRTTVNFAPQFGPRDSWMHRPFDADESLRSNRFTVRGRTAEIHRALLRSGGNVAEIQGDKLLFFDRTERYWRAGGRDYLMVGGGFCSGRCPRRVAAIFELKPDFTVGPMLCVDIRRDPNTRG
jgi:hypothetical protein